MPPPTAGAPAPDWTTYTHPRLGYTLEVPGDWSVDDTREYRTDLYSPGEIAAVQVTVHDPIPPSMEEWLEQSIAQSRARNADFFHIIGQEIRAKPDGSASAAAVIYIGRTGPEYCTTLRHLYLVLTRDLTQSLESRICQEVFEKYAATTKRIIRSALATGSQEG